MLGMWDLGRQARQHSPAQFPPPREHTVPSGLCRDSHRDLAGAGGAGSQDCMTAQRRRLWQRALSPQQPKNCPDIFQQISRMRDRTGCRVLALVLTNEGGALPTLWEAATGYSVLSLQITARPLFDGWIRHLLQSSSLNLPTWLVKLRRVGLASSEQGMVRDPGSSFKNNWQSIQETIQAQAAAGQVSSYMIAVQHGNNQPQIAVHPELAKNLRDTVEWQGVKNAMAAPRAPLPAGPAHRHVNMPKGECTQHVDVDVITIECTLLF